MQRTVFLPVISLHVRGAAADQVEGDNPEFFIEGRRQIAPHALVAAEPVREQHGDGAVAMDLDVIALLNCHAECALMRGCRRSGGNDWLAGAGFARDGNTKRNSGFDWECMRLFGVFG
jgi:hypothetical protein